MLDQAGIGLRVRRHDRIEQRRLIGVDEPVAGHRRHQIGRTDRCRPRDRHVERRVIEIARRQAAANRSGPFRRIAGVVGEHQIARRAGPRIDRGSGIGDKICVGAQDDRIARRSARSNRLVGTDHQISGCVRRDFRRRRHGGVIDRQPACQRILEINRPGVTTQRRHLVVASQRKGPARPVQGEQWCRDDLRLGHSACAAQRCRRCRGNPSQRIDRPNRKAAGFRQAGRRRLGCNRREIIACVRQGIGSRQCQPGPQSQIVGGERMTLCYRPCTACYQLQQTAGADNGCRNPVDRIDGKAIVIAEPDVAAR